MHDLRDQNQRGTQVTIVIPNWNGMKWLPGCLSSVENQTFKDYKVTLIDNHSSDGSVAWVRQNFEDISIIQLDQNQGFAAAVNIGVKTSDSPYVALLNSDTQVQPKWLEHLVSTLDNSSDAVGAVAPLMLSMQNKILIDDAGNQLSWYGEASKMGQGIMRSSFLYEEEVFSPSAGASLYRRKFFEDCGFFDEDFFAYLEDIDLGLRGRIMGYRYLFDPLAEVLHQSHGSQIDYELYITLVTQNRLLLFLKNVPFKLLVKHFPKIIYGQVYYLLAFGHLGASLRGYLGFLSKFGSALAERKAILRKRVLDDAFFDQMLHKRKPGEGIFFHLKKLWK
jgi:GT2 family glycosyltransferase